MNASLQPCCPHESPHIFDDASDSACAAYHFHRFLDGKEVDTSWLDWFADTVDIQFLLLMLREWADLTLLTAKDEEIYGR